MFKNIILHWTAGGYSPCPVDILSYHFVIDKDGEITKGKFTPEDNINCKDGKYAAHCGGGNTGRIGIAICCRKDVNTPPTKAQIEAMCELSAQLCQKYRLTPKQCLTHAEFNQLYPNASKKVKIDINSIPYANKTGIKPCGDFLRERTWFYYNQLYL